jgi:hypothetical protein
LIGCNNNYPSVKFNVYTTYLGIKSSDLITEYKGYSIHKLNRCNVIQIHYYSDPCIYLFLDGKITRPENCEDTSMEIKGNEMVGICKKLGVISFFYLKSLNCTYFNTNTFVNEKYDPNKLKKSSKYGLIYFYQEPDSTAIKEFTERYAPIFKIEDNWYYFETNAYWKDIDITREYSWIYLLIHH